MTREPAHLAYIILPPVTYNNDYLMGNTLQPGRETLEGGRLWLTARHNLFQMCGHIVNDKWTKGGNRREDIWEKPLHMLQSAPHWAKRWGGVECGELGEREGKDLFSILSNRNGYLCSTDTTDLLWRLRKLWEINLKKWLPTPVNIFCITYKGYMNSWI